MENIVLDSCVFFGMLKYYKIYKTYGENVLLKLFGDDKREIAAEKEKIRLNYASYFEKYEKEYSFEEIVDKIKENYSSKISSCDKKIKSLEFVRQGINPKSQEKDLKITPERMNNAAEKIKALQLEHDKYANDENFASIANYKDKTKNKENSLENGMLFLNIAKKRLKPFIVQPGFDEILNHTMPKEDEADWVVYNEELVDGMMHDYVSLITTHSQKALDDINYLSEQFRKPTKNANTKEMAQDINSNGVFGDALIVAWSNVAGMPLITQNIKDFIYNGRIKRGNDHIRQNIQAVSKEIPFATSALPYSTYELLHNECEFVDEQNSGYALREMFNENYIYNLKRMSGQKQIEKAMLLEEV